MARPIKEIVQELVADHRPGGPDGATNRDRINYICEVFDTDYIDLLADYDFDRTVLSKDLDKVVASKHLVLLKLELLRRQYDAFHVTEEQYALQSSVLTLAFQKINWHAMHLAEGRITPPFPSLH